MKNLGRYGRADCPFSFFFFFPIQRPCFATPRFELYLRRRNTVQLRKNGLMHVNKVNLQPFIPRQMILFDQARLD